MLSDLSVSVPFERDGKRAVKPHLLSQSCADYRDLRGKVFLRTFFNNAANGIE